MREKKKLLGTWGLKCGGLFFCSYSFDFMFYDMTICFASGNQEND